MLGDGPWPTLDGACLHDYSRSRGRLKEATGEFMNFRNRYLVIAIRTLLGLIMLASGISGLLMGNSTQGVPEQMVAFTQVFWASGIFQWSRLLRLLQGSC